MAGDWHSYRLEELCEFINGFAFKSTDYVSPFADTIEVFRMGYIKRGGGFKEDNSPVFVPRKYGKNLDKYFLKPGDVTIAMTDMKDRVAILGNTAWIREAGRFVVNQRVGCMRVKRPDLLEPRFFYFYSNWSPHIDYLRSRANSGVQVNLSTSAIKESELTVPPLAEQKAIAAILGSLDDKIELNRRMNATLEAMARALFQSWFVDFDPVRAKLDGRVPVGMDAATAALFPDSFQDAGVGHIPSGWIVEPVGNVVNCLGGGTPSTSEPKYWGCGVHHWTTPKDFSALQAPVLLDTSLRLTDAGVAKISSGLLPAGTLLLSSRAPVGYLAIAAMPVAINQGFIALKCNERASNFFMLNWCQTNMAEIESRATGTTFAEISKQNFRPIPVVLPPKGLMAAFTAKVAPLYAQITANLHQSRTLATLRDTLLPKLLSGELSVAGGLNHVSEVFLNNGYYTATNRFMEGSDFGTPASGVQGSQKSV